MVVGKMSDDFLFEPACHSDGIVIVGRVGEYCHSQLFEAWAFGPPPEIGGG